MTTLYEHKILGSKISMVNANFNIPFLSGNGNICLYESGITLLDENGSEKYIIELNEFKMKYEKFINVRNLKYTSKANIFTKNIGRQCRNTKHVFKRVNGNFYGKFVITVPEVGDIVLLDNRSFKYKHFYEKINSLKFGINPLDISNDVKENPIIKFLKSKFSIKN